MKEEEPTLAAIGENALVKRLVSSWRYPARVLVGAGDDCAVVDHGSFWQLLKTDAVVEGVHFLPETPPAQVGRKAICRALSDIAAMGGLPGEALVTLGLPAHRAVSWVEELYRGMERAAETWGLALVGGETTSSGRGDAAWLSISLTGQVAPGRAVLRSGGREGDGIFVTGTLGGSLAGKHLDFAPRLREAQWLVEQGPPTAMMDLSDGLAKDLPRLVKASGCGYQVEPRLIPCSVGCGVDAAASDGEDYELLFTFPADKEERLLLAWRLAFPELPLTRIGRLTASGVAEGLGDGGWEHFS